MSQVLVVSGGAWQAPLISFLKAKGHTVFVADPYSDSPGVIIADGHIKADVRDETAICEAIRELGLEPQFIVTDQSDISVETANNLSHHFKLPANPKDTVRLFVNKYYSRQYAATVNMPAPRWLKVSTPEELQLAIEQIGLPVIIKPPDNQASCGVYKITQDNVHRSAELFASGLEYSGTGYMLCEEYVEGIGISIEGFCSAGQHRSFAASVKDHFPSGVIASLLYPTIVPEPLLSEIFAANDRYVENSGLKFGITHGEYIVDVDSGKFWLVEIACRGAGTRVSSDIAHWVSGVSFHDLLYSELNGNTTDVKKLQLKRRAALLEFFEFGAGLVESISGVEEARAIPGVFDLNLVFKEGEQLQLAQNGRTRHGFYIAFGETHEDVRKIAAKVHQTIHVDFVKDAANSALPETLLQEIR